MTIAAAPVVHGRAAEAAWQTTDTPGLTLALLRPQDGGASILLRFEKGVAGAEHVHPGGEELVVLSGDITIGGVRLGAGDYLYTPPGEAHAAQAHEDTVLFVSLPKLPIYL